MACETECHDWSSMAWSAACRANGVKIEYDKDAYKLVGHSVDDVLKVLLIAMR